MSVRCRCGRPCREGQHNCHDCHAAAQRELRARRKAEKEALVGAVLSADSIFYDQRNSEAMDEWRRRNRRLVQSLKKKEAACASGPR